MWPERMAAFDGGDVAGISTVWPTPVDARETLRVWRIDLTAVSGSPGDLRVLSSSERERARTFREPTAASRFVAGRVALRVILAAYLDVAPGDVRLVNGPFGRPELATGSPCFSLSRSRDIALVALSVHAPVGVDVECVRDQRGRGSADVDDARTLQSWTRTEAVLKALGFGLSVEPDRLAIRSDVGAPPQVTLDRRAVPVRRLLDIDAGHGCVACVAELEAPPQTLSRPPAAPTLPHRGDSPGG